MQKIKDFIQSDRGKDILMVLIVILVGTGSFGLGRLSKDSKAAGVQIEYPNQAANVVSAQESIDEAPPVSNISETTGSKFVKTSTSPTTGSTSSTGKEFFASKIGHKYYSIGCPGGKTIKQENRVYFSTETEAQAAGFTKSTSCK